MHHLLSQHQHEKHMLCRCYTRASERNTHVVDAAIRNDPSISQTVCYRSVRPAGNVLETTHPCGLSERPCPIQPRNIPEIEKGCTACWYVWNELYAPGELFVYQYSSMTYDVLRQHFWATKHLPRLTESEWSSRGRSLDHTPKEKTLAARVWSLRQAT